MGVTYIHSNSHGESLKIGVRSAWLSRLLNMSPRNHYIYCTTLECINKNLERCQYAELCNVVWDKLCLKGSAAVREAKGFNLQYERAKGAKIGFLESNLDMYIKNMISISSCNLSQMYLLIRR